MRRSLSVSNTGAADNPSIGKIAAALKIAGPGTRKADAGDPGTAISNAQQALIWTTVGMGRTQRGAGPYDDWIAAKTGFTMGLLHAERIPFQYALADAFHKSATTNFCSAMVRTDPNRLYLWSGMIDPGGWAVARQSKTVHGT